MQEGNLDPTEPVDDTTQDAYCWGPWGIGISVDPDSLFEDEEPPSFTVFLKLSKNGVQLGTLDLVTQVDVGDELILRECHIHGLAKGAIGIEGLNAIAQALMEDFGVQSAVVEGGTRTTGLRRGKTPKPRRHVRRPYSSDAP